MLLLLPFAIVALVSSSEVRDSGLCSQVFQMHQYCKGFSNSTVVQGPAGPPGPPGIVDYAAIKAVIDVRFAALQSQLDAKLKQFEDKAQAILEKIAASGDSDATKKSSDIHVCENEHITRSGVFNLQYKGRNFDGFCDLETDAKPWLVIQRRMDGSVDFSRGWNDYVNGFGNLSGEHWLGLETVHNLTTEAPHELRVELEDWNGNKRYASYSTFSVSSADSYYTLNIGGYSGDAGDSIITVSNGRSFTTTDQDHDLYSGGNCAVLFKGAWWHNTCHESNLNGKYLRGSHTTYADGIEWKAWKGYYYSLKFTEMKIRPIDADTA